MSQFPLHTQTKECDLFPYTFNAFLQGRQKGGVQHSVLSEPPPRRLQGQEEEAVVPVREHARGRKLSKNVTLKEQTESHK